MRITFFITMGIERPSGRRYFSIARELVAQGHLVRVLALHPDLATCHSRRFTAEGVEVWYVGQMHARKRGTQTERFGPLQLLWVLVTSTLGMIWGGICSPSDVYHLGKPQPVNGLAAIVSVMLLRGQRFYVDCDDDEVQSNRLTAGWQRAVFGFWQSLLPRLAAGVTVNTHFLAERMRQRGIKPVVYVPNGVDLVHFQRPPERALAGLRAALGISERRVIAYAGTLALQNHPVDLLIEAFAAIAPTMPDVVLLLIGGGEDVEALKEQVRRLNLQNRVYFTGHVAPEQVPAYMSLAEVSVDPAHDDDTARARSPLKLFESMALGVPVVTGDVGDRAEVLDYGSAGMLVPPGSSAALAQALVTLLTEPELLRTLAQRGRELVQTYTWHELATRWFNIYAEARL